MTKRLSGLSAFIILSVNVAPIIPVTMSPAC